MIAASYQDPLHRYVWCDACTSLGVRLEPMEVQIMGPEGDLETREVGIYLSAVEAREWVRAHGWLTDVECLIGERRFFRDYCPRCRQMAVVA